VKKDKPESIKVAWEPSLSTNGAKIRTCSISSKHQAKKQLKISMTLEIIRILDNEICPR
jgi:hypothetical protein